MFYRYTYLNCTATPENFIDTTPSPLLSLVDSFTLEVRVNRWGYVLLPDAASSAPKATKGAYAAMLKEFAEGPHARVRVQYAERGAQAIYMGLRTAKKIDDRFADIRIIKRGNMETGQVFLEK